MRPNPTVNTGSHKLKLFARSRKMPPNPSLSADVRMRGLRPRSGPPLSLFR